MILERDSSDSSSSEESDDTIEELSDHYSSDDESEDVMLGIVDSDDENTEVSSVSTDAFLKLIPPALSPTAGIASRQHAIGSTSEQPQSEKAVDRLLMMVKFPNADEEQIRDVLRRKELQQHAANIAASRKGQAFRERQQHDDDELWKQQQEKEQLKQLQEQRLQDQQQQQQQPGANDSLVALQEEDPFGPRGAFDTVDQEEEDNNGESSSNDGFADTTTTTTTTTDVSGSILPKRSLGGEDDVAEVDDTVLWQPANSEDDCVPFESGGDDGYNGRIVGLSNSVEEDVENDGDIEEQRNGFDNESIPKEERSKSRKIVEQTRKSFSSVLGGASKVFGKVFPRASSDRNAASVPLHSMDHQQSSPITLVSSDDEDNTNNSIGEVVSVNTAVGGDNRSYASSKISNQPSQASAVTYKISNVRSMMLNKKDKSNKKYKNSSGVKVDHHALSNANTDYEFNNSDFEDLDHTQNNTKGCCGGDSVFRRWILDRKKNKILIGVFSLIIVLAIIVTVLAAVNGRQRRADINKNESATSSSSENNNQQVVIVDDSDDLAPTQSPSARASTNTNLGSPETIATSPVYDVPEETLSPSEKNQDSNNDLNFIGDNIMASAATMDPVGDAANSPSSLRKTNAPTISTTAAPSLSATLPPISTTSDPTETPSSLSTSLFTSSSTPIPTSLATSKRTSTPTEEEVLDGIWGEENKKEDAILLKGIPDIDQHFGKSIVLSEDGLTLVVGAPDALSKAGIVRIYQWKDDSWVATGSLLGRNEGDQFGSTVALSADGRVLAVSEPTFDGSAGDKTGNIRTYVYSPFGYVSRGQDIEGEEATDQFGIGMALSSDGLRLAVGSPSQDNTDKVTSKNRMSNHRVSNGKERLVSGTARVFEWSEEKKAWFLVGDNRKGAPLMGTDNLDMFGMSIDLNNDGSLVCIGAPRNAIYGGYVKCFEEAGTKDGAVSDYSTTQWQQVGRTIRNQDGLVRYDDNFGASVRVSQDPTGKKHRVAIGVPGKDSENAIQAGHVVVYEFDAGVVGPGWTLLGKRPIALGTPGTGFQMGISLDLHEDLLAVGIPGANNNTGKVEFFEYREDTDEWVRNPSAFDGDATDSGNGDDDNDAESPFCGADVSMTPDGAFAIGCPLSDDSVGSVEFHRRKSP